MALKSSFGLTSDTSSLYILSSLIFRSWLSQLFGQTTLSLLTCRLALLHFPYNVVLKPQQDNPFLHEIHFHPLPTHQIHFCSSYTASGLWWSRFIQFYPCASWLYLLKLFYSNNFLHIYFSCCTHHLFHHHYQQRAVKP